MKRLILSMLISMSTALVMSPSLQAASEDNVITWAGCGITKKAFMAELAKAYEDKTGIKVLLQGGGATRGIRDAVGLRMDMGGSCRMSLPTVNRTELHASLHPVAWDALVVITHKSNPISNLSQKQIQDIYRGKITHWRQISKKAPNAPIHLYIRKGKVSGVGYTIRQYLFKNSEIDFVTKSKYKMRSSGPLEKSIEKDKYGIGITGVSSARKRNVKILHIDNHSPTYENVARGKYLLYRPLYLVTSPTPSKKVKDFVSFAKSREGRAIIKKNGTVPYLEALNLMDKMVIYGFDVR